MSDLISRQDAIDAVVRESQVDGAYGYMDTKSIVDLLHDMPTIKAQKTGKWIIFPPCIEEICMCSNCKTKFKEAYQHRNICPNCGARMVGEEE